VRPEDIRVVPPGAPGGVVGTVSARTFRRDHFLLAVRVDGGDGDGEEPVLAEVPVHAGWIPDLGERVGLAAHGLVALADD
jgi:hypothetical protein